MKTITFYSYKGGVGRSLALSNIARRLSELNKKVCILDFDLDAPGLQFKFMNHYAVPAIKNGLVDYIYKFNQSGIIEESLVDYASVLIPNSPNCTSLSLIPAGNIYDNEYWRKLSMISWADMFYSDHAKGIQFFLDLKHKIETQIQPDFLLIDSRTGITDISGITLRLFADEVVILGVNNDENIFGSKMIIKNLLNQDGALFDKLPKINFVLTRVPFTDTPEDKAKENHLINQLTAEFKEHLQLQEFNINVIHSDRRLEEQERQLIGYALEEKAVSISNDYLKLFDLLTAGLLSNEELQHLNMLKSAEKEFNKYLIEPQLFKKLEHINKALQLDPKNPIYLFSKASLYDKMNQKPEAIDGYLETLKLVDKKSRLAHIAYHNISMAYNELRQFDKAMEYVNFAISALPERIHSLELKMIIYDHLNQPEEARKIGEYIINELKEESAHVYNYLADYYRKKGNYKTATELIVRAIELNPDEPVVFATLAEIDEAEGDIDSFYINLTIALSKNLTVDAFRSAKDIYLKYEHDPKMIELLELYNIDFEAIKAL